MEEILSSIRQIEWKVAGSLASAVAAIGIFCITQIILFAEKRKEKFHQIQTLQVALSAELKVALEQNGEARYPKKFEKIVRDASIEVINAYAIPSRSRPIFEKNCDKIGILPPKAADAVVEAYGHFELWNSFVEHFKSKEFKKSPPDVQDVMIGYWIQTNYDVVRTSKKARARLRLEGRHRNTCVKFVWKCISRRASSLKKKTSKTLSDWKTTLDEAS